MIRRIYGKIVLPQEYINTSYWSILASMCIIFMIVYILTWMISRCRKTWGRILAYTILLTLFSVDIFLLERFGMAISPTMLILLAETNRQESMEFIHTFLGWKDNQVVYSVLLFILILIIILENTYRPIFYGALRKITHRQKGLLAVLSIFTLCCLSIGAWYSKTYVKMLQCDDTDALTLWASESPCDPLTNTFYAIYGIHLSKTEITKAVENSLSLHDDIRCNEDSLILIFVIGESYIKQHATVYGYGLNTTPNLYREQECGNLYVFTNVCAPFNQTTLVMKNLLSCNSISDGESWSSMPYMPGVFNKGGFDVLFWDNQRDNNSVFEFTLNKYIYNDRLATFYTDTNHQPERYDGDLIASFKARNDRNDGPLQFVMFHLWGQHLDPEQRYPQTSGFKHFTADSINRTDGYLMTEMKQTIAHYDNATLYNDYVINEIFNLFKNKNAALVYLSDHGEEVYDYRDNIGRRSGGMNDNILKYQYAVPFMIWFSSAYQERHPETMEAVKGALNRPFMTDNVCQVLFHLGGIQSKYYKRERDLLSNQYRSPKRLVNRTIDYDRIINVNH